MLTEKEIVKLEATTVTELAMMLEDGLLNGCWLHEETSALEFIKNFLCYETTTLK